MTSIGLPTFQVATLRSASALAKQNAQFSFTILRLFCRLRVVQFTPKGKQLGRVRFPGGQPLSRRGSEMAGLPSADTPVPNEPASLDEGCLKNPDGFHPGFEPN